MLADVCENPVGNIHHMTIFEPDDDESPRPKKLLTHIIPAGRVLAIMRGPFKLNDQPFGSAVEIDNVRPDALLAPEFPAVQIRAPQHSPQSGLRRRQVGAKRTAPIQQSACIVQPS